jgi:hypothetical protein
MDETRLPPLPGGHSEQLLPTSVQDVPPEYVEALARFCADATEIARGYICTVEVERDGAETERQLKFCVKLDALVSEPQDSRETSFALVTRLSESQPHLVRELGFGVMADRAVAAWEAKALRIYPR